MIADVPIADTVVARLASAIGAFHLGAARFAVAGEPLPRAPGAACVCFGLDSLLIACILPVALGLVSIERAAALGVTGMCRVARRSARRRSMRGARRCTRRLPEYTVGTADDFGTGRKCRT